MATNQRNLRIPYSTLKNVLGKTRAIQTDLLIEMLRFFPTG